MTVIVKPLTGAALRAVIPELAQLRITVFREFPYLYDGDLAYEHGYLSTYIDSPGAIVVGAFHGDRLIGAATGTPMQDHAAEFTQAFEGSGMDLSLMFYCAESVLLPAYRGQGIGHQFFDHREAHARRLGADQTAFCAVIRSADHPARPKDYSPLDPFWRKRGYAPLDGVIAHFDWKEPDTEGQTRKSLQFWLKQLSARVLD